MVHECFVHYREHMTTDDMHVCNVERLLFTNTRSQYSIFINNNYQVHTPCSKVKYSKVYVDLYSTYYVNKPLMHS